MEVKSKLAGTIGSQLGIELQGKELEMVIEKMTEMRNTYQGIFYERLKSDKVPLDLNCGDAIEFLFKDIWVGSKDQRFNARFILEVLFEDKIDFEGMLFEPEYKLSLKTLINCEAFLNKWLVTGF